MSQNTKKHLTELVLIIMIIIIGMTVVTVVGLVNNNFFPKKIPTEIVLTKSPLKVIFRGNDQISLENLVKDAKDFPFVDYKFNSNLNIKLEDIQSDSSNAKIDIKENTSNIVSNTNKIQTNKSGETNETR